MALTCDASLFEALEGGAFEASPEKVIAAALRIKMAVVTADERETGLRRILNFGHTLGHGIEAVSGGSLYHGECVALGMIPMCSDAVRVRLLDTLRALGLPTSFDADLDSVLEKLAHDKKCDGDRLSVVWVDRIGTCEIRTEKISVWQAAIRAACTQKGGDGQ